MQIDIVKAWKDPNYRASLSPEQLAAVPENPAGTVEYSLVEEKDSPKVTIRGCHPNTNDNTYTCVLQ